MSRRTDLEANIRSSNDLIRRYEAILRLSSEPKEQERARQIIQEQEELIKGYVRSYISLSERLNLAIPDDIAEAAAIANIALPPRSATPVNPSQPTSAYVYDVFISYSSHNRPWMYDVLRPRLEDKGFRTCIDIRDFHIGAPSVSEMERAVLTSRKTVLVLTPAYVTSDWTRFETLMLQTVDPANQERRLIPVLKEKCDIPLRISYLTYVDLTDPANQEYAWGRLLQAVCS